MDDLLSCLSAQVMMIAAMDYLNILGFGAVICVMVINTAFVGYLWEKNK